MNYFNQQVLDALAHHQVQLNDTEKLAYAITCHNIKSLSKAMKTLKDPEELRTYSLWHLPQKDKNNVISHWLIIPAPDHMVTKASNVIPKIAVNIVTGEKQFVKIRRPEGDHHETEHVKDSIIESKNFGKLGIDAFHCERNLFHGYKAYLFQPYEGDINLLDIFENQNTPAREILGFLIASGEALQKMHDSGYLHCDFKLQNIVYNSDKQIVSLVDLEFLLSIEDGNRGIKQFRGTPGYLHPDWLRSARADYIRGHRVKYTTNNDVAAFLHASDIALQEACLRPNTEEQSLRLDLARTQIREWKSESFENLPALFAVLGYLKQLTIQPKINLIENMAALRLHQNKM